MHCSTNHKSKTYWQRAILITATPTHRAVLQNLFFATLNTEIDKRGFSTSSYTTHRDFSRYRYKTQMRNSDRTVRTFRPNPLHQRRLVRLSGTVSKQEEKAVTE